MLPDQFSKAESLVEFAHQDQAAVGSDARALGIDPPIRLEVQSRLENRQESPITAMGSTAPFLC